MKPSRLLLALTTALILAGAAYVSQVNERTGAQMARAANDFLASLTEDQRAKATLPFDDPERFNWHFVPLQDAQKRPTRKGLRLEEMNEAQQRAARELVRTGTSPDGYQKATTIMSLESILHELEKAGPVRNPGWYFFTVFGTPSRTGRWGWRVEGHHLSLNFVVDGANIVSATPAFFGANPAIVRQGARKGTRALPEAEELAGLLVAALDTDQKAAAHQGMQFPEVEGQTKRPRVGTPAGLAGAKMTEKQRTLLWKLLRAYAGRMPADVAAAELQDVEKAGLDQVYFAYAGEVAPGTPHTYRVQGPTFRVEFLNVQADSAHNPANHIHSVWRNAKGDFGVSD
jgi:hypothetical protein